jgi:hypothetical protein
MGLRWIPASRLLAVVVATIGWVASASAQEAQPPAPVPHPLGQLRLGTLSFTPTFRISNIGLDTNVFDASGVERQPADLTATFTPGVDIGLTTSRLNVHAQTRSDFVYYQKYKSEQAVNPSIELQADDRLSSRLALYAKGAYGYGKQRTGFEIDSRPTAFSHNTLAGIKVGGPKLRLDLHGAFGAVAYDPGDRFLNASIAQTLNQRTMGGGATAEYALTPYTTVTLGADEALRRFALSPDRDINSLTTSLGLRFSPRAMIAGDASIGYQRVDPLASRTPAFDGLTPRAGLSYRLKDLFSASAGIERGLESSFFGDRPYYIFLLYEGSARLAIFHHFDIGGSVQRTTLSYRTFLDAASTSIPREFVDMDTLSVGVPLKSQLRVGCFAQRWRRVSVDRPYETTRIGLEMTVGPVTMNPRGIYLSGPSR